MLIPSFALADQYDDQIARYKEEIARNQAAAAEKHAQADTLKNKIAQLQSEINAASAALELTRTRISQTEAQIDETNARLDQQKKTLKENLRVIYKDGDVSPLELVASSKNLNDFVSQRTYLDSIKKKVDETIKTIGELKEQLVAKKKDLDRLALDQSAQLDTINAQKAEQANLLAQTEGEESAYQRIVAQNRSAMNAVIAARAALFAQSGSGGGGGIGSARCGGGYPAKWCNGALDQFVDDWGYYTRECTSYVAWRRALMGKPVGRAWGNAGTWMRFADHYSNPHPGDIMVMPVSPYADVGHVAIVESADANGVTISQYNWNVGDGWGMYSSFNIPYRGSPRSVMLNGVGYID